MRKAGLTAKSTIPGKAFYESFLNEIRTAYSPDKIKGTPIIPHAPCDFFADEEDGQFGAMMQVSLTNDVSLLSRNRAERKGPVTILLSSRDKPIKSGTSTPTKADEMRLKQKEIADSKARKREEFEARKKEKEVLKKEKEEDWKRRNGAGADKEIEELKIE